MSNDAFNEQQVKKTLKLVLKILEKEKIEYRLLGSVVTAAIMGEQHRKLGDIDLLIDKKHREKFLSILKDKGFFPRKDFVSALSTLINVSAYDHDELLEVGVFWGTWKNGAFIIGTEKNGTVIDAHAVYPTKYSLHDINFIGLPKGIIARGLQLSKQNPKREKALKFFAKNKIEPHENNYLHTFVLGIQIDSLYYLSMIFLNILGRLRIAFGKPFDPWR